MIKSIKTIQSTDKEKYRVPKKVQDVIPIKRIWPDGIFQVGSKFVKSWKFADINYLVASREDKESMFLTYSELLLNQSAFVLGVPGSGKSFSVKELIAFLILNTEDDILICDPEGEYAPLIEAMGDIGSVIRVSAGGRDRLNAMYMVDGYGENNPIVVKSEFIMSLIEQIDKKGVGPQHKETFKYNECVTMNEEAFSEFMTEVHARELYDTGVDAEFGDQLLTLSTCEYTYKNGRFVVVAKKVV